MRKFNYLNTLADLRFSTGYESTQAPPVGIDLIMEDKWSLIIISLNLLRFHSIDFIWKFLTASFKWMSKNLMLRRG